jgi:hypothetical protein
VFLTCVPERVLEVQCYGFNLFGAQNKQYRLLHSFESKERAFHDVNILIQKSPFYILLFLAVNEKPLESNQKSLQSITTQVCPTLRKYSANYQNQFSIFSLL